MADPSRYVVDPNTGETLVVAEGETDPTKVATYLDRAQKQGYKPATTDQIAKYDREAAAYQQAAAEPVLGRAKTLASSLGRGLVGTITDIPLVATTIPEALAGAAETIGTKIRPDLAEAYRRQTESVRETFAPGKKVYREVTATKLEQSLLGRTPEEQRAYAETYPGFEMAGTVASFFGPQIVEKVVTKGVEKAAIKVAAAKAGEAVAERVAAEAAPAAERLATEGVETAGQRAAQVAEQESVRNPAVLEATAAAQRVELATQRSIAAELTNKKSLAAQALKIAQKAGTVTTPALGRALAKPVEAGVERVVSAAATPAVAIGERLVAPLADTLAESSVKALVDAAPAVRQLPRVTQEIVAKAAAQGAGSVIEAGLFQLGQGVHEDILGDHDLTAERAWAHMTDGALTNAALGAGLSVLPSALRGALSTAGTATKATRDVILKRFPQLVEALGGTAAEAEILAANREAFRRGEANLAELIEADLAKRQPLPAQPSLIEGIAGIPAPIPKPIKPVSALTRAESDAFVDELLPVLKAERGSADSLLNQVKGTVLPQQAAKAIDAEYAARALPAQQAYLESIGGVAKTPEHVAQLNAIAENTLAPARQAARDLSGVIAQAELNKIAQASVAIPQTTFVKLLEIGNEAVRLSEQATSAAEIQRGIARLKDELAQLRPKMNQTTIDALPNADRTALSVINEAFGAFKSASESPELWGDVTGRISKYMNAATQFYAWRKNWLQFAGRKMVLPGGKKFTEYDAKKVRSIFSDMPNNQDAIQAYVNYRNSINDLHQAGREIAEGYSESYGSESLAGALSSADTKYEQAVTNATRRVDYSAQKELYAAKKTEAEAATAQREQIISARKESLASQQRAYEEALDARKEAAKQRAQVLGDLGKTGAVVDHLATAGTAAGILLHSTSPWLLAASAAIKGGRIVVNPVKTMKTLAWLEKGGQITNKALQSAAEVATGVATGAVKLSIPIRASMNMKEERRLYEERVSKIGQLVGDGESLTAHADETIDPIRYDAPKVSERAKDTKVRAIATVASAIPRPPPTLSPIERMNWQPNDMQVREFNRKYDAVGHPTGVLARSAEGTATLPEINTVEQVYPALTEHYKQLLMENLRKNPNISAARRQMLRQFYGIDVDGSIRTGAGAQAVYGQQGQPPQASGEKPMKIGQGRALQGVAGRESAETTAWREAQRNARAGSGTR